MDVAEGDWFTLSFDNTLAEVKTGKNGNSIFAQNAMGAQGTATLRLIRGSPDDKAIDALLQSQMSDFEYFQTLKGQFTKTVGDGQGNVTPDQYRASGGIFTHQVDAKSNAEADTEQSVSVYRLRFANVQRILN
ncbi:MAG: hypothetical protein KGJ86_00665 [Chloroflexota bacterium]|nr:hypothetical protein [Chloroflexota bacterium]